MLGGQAGNVSGAGNGHGNLRDTGGNIVCPVHRWTSSKQGKLIGAPQFPKTPCMDLQSYTLKQCHGFLFEGTRNPAQDMPALFKKHTLAFDRSEERRVGKEN